MRTWRLKPADQFLTVAGYLRNLRMPMDDHLRTK